MGGECRLAARAKRIVERRSSQSPAVAVYLGTLPAQADAYCQSYDTAAKYRIDHRREMEQGQAALAALVKSVRSWLPLVVRDVPGFDRTLYLDQPAVPDDVIEDSARLLDVVRDAKDAAGQPLAYVDAAVKDLDPKIMAAAKECAEAESADRRYQELLEQVRKGANALQGELIALRRTLAAAVGTSDKDYQKLRAARAGLPDDEDDPGAPPAPVPVEPAPAGAAAPKMVN